MSEETDFKMSVIASVRLDRHENDVEPRRALALAARWRPEFEAPIETPKGADAQSLLRRLAEGEDIPIGQLDIGILWAEAALKYYKTTEPPVEAYREPWKEAAEDMRTAARWLRSMRRALLKIPATVTVKDEPWRHR